MTDARLRQLERRFQETGAAEDEAAWLVERVRAGALEQDRLELAAFLGHAAARLALPEGPRLEDMKDAQQVAKHLARHGKEALVRALLSQTRRLFDQLRVREDRPPSQALDAVAAALWALEDWLLCPCPAHVEAVAMSASAVHIGSIRFASLLLALGAAAGVVAAETREQQRSAARLAIAPGSATHASAELNAWALGYPDPVATRVAARSSGGSPRG